MEYSVRKLSLVKDEALEQASLRIAFATNDQEHVNQHFGTSSMFALYELTESYWQLIEMVKYADTQKGHNEQKLHNRIEALKGCQAIYCNAIGSSAIRQLLAENIHPVKVNPEQNIVKILVDINQHLNELLERDDRDQEYLFKSNKVIKSEANTQWVNKALLSQAKSNSSTEGRLAENENRLTELLDEEW